MATSPNDRRIDYVEFGVADIAKSKAFYGDAFGWTFVDYGPQYISRAGSGFISQIPMATSWPCGARRNCRAAVLRPHRGAKRRHIGLLPDLRLW